MQTDKLLGQNIIKEYRRYLRLERNFSVNTLEAYMLDVQKLLHYMQGAQLDVTQVANGGDYVYNADVEQGKLTTLYAYHCEEGENLLAQKYEYIAGMPMPRATFMGGVNVEW